MSGVTPVVYVVDDDISVRESLECLIATAGWRPEVFASAQEFLAHPRQPAPSCLLLDIRPPDLNGLELQKRIVSERAHLPISFITGYGDIPMTVRAMEAGAIEFLTKPLGTDALFSAIENALERSRACLDQQANLRELQERHASLSPREREVMALVVRG